MTNRLAWMDVISTDIDRSLDYYAELFGWTSERLPIDHGEDYRMVKSGNVIVAGAEQVSVDRNLAPVWTVMIETDDARTLIDAAVAAGAVESFVLAPMLDLGRIAMLRDPWGATLGVWEPGTFQPSDSPLSSGSLVGAELTCPDPPAARDYHREVFGWRDVIGGPDLDAGLPVYVEHRDGPAVWTPILHRPHRGLEESIAADDGLRQLFDPMGARFYVRA